jgi:hypothetical protein
VPKNASKRSKNIKNEPKLIKNGGFLFFWLREFSATSLERFNCF